ncbi:MAG: NAD-dependent epimerase/dehydratase family protein [Planctomycetaceae bacterium]
MATVVVGLTGAHGFVGQHVHEQLRRLDGVEVIACERDWFSQPRQLASFASQCDTIIHLAAMNRGEDQEIYETNILLAEQLVDAIEETGRTKHIVFSSSTQRDTDRPYGKSKRRGEEIFTQWAEANGASCSLLVIPNVYGAGCRPFYNSVVATFCHQLTHGEQPKILEDREVSFIPVNDLSQLIAERSVRHAEGVSLEMVDGPVKLTINGLLKTLEEFREDYFVKQVIPDLTDPVRASLYTTFCSYLDPKDHVHPAFVRSDERGSLFEVIKLANAGQVFFSTTKPGVIRGNHFHRRKVEWFCVVKGEAVIRLRRIGGDAVQEFRVSGDQPEFISIPVFHTHHIENVGESELLTMFWCNEIFDAADADTWFEKVA